MARSDTASQQLSEPANPYVSGSADSAHALLPRSLSLLDRDVDFVVGHRNFQVLLAGIAHLTVGQRMQLE